GFVAAYTAQQAGLGGDWSVLVGILAAMVIGSLVALIIAIGGIALRRDQVAVGFVLTLLAAGLAQFLGQSYTRIPGPTIVHWPLPGLSSLPIIGPIFFQHDIIVYFSYALILGTWFWLFRTRSG